jgi:hypothetical protein
MTVKVGDKVVLKGQESAGEHLVIGLGYFMEPGRPVYAPRKRYTVHVQSIANPSLLALYFPKELEAVGRWSA